jgi:hypothetical protein
MGGEYCTYSRGGGKGLKNDAKPDNRPVYPHPDCAVCIYWVNGCSEKHDPSTLGPYQKCWWCRTEDKPKKAATRITTGKLF